jgi:hypothetical protein
MKALYDKRDRDYYIFFEKGEIAQLLEGVILRCLLYLRSSERPIHIEYMRPNFEISVLEKNTDLLNRSKDLLENNSYSYYYGDVLLEYPLKGLLNLILSKEWIKQDLNQELLDWCGKSEQRYGHSSGCKVHFYSEDSKHRITNEMKLVFEMEELAWERDHGSGIW